MGETGRGIPEIHVGQEAGGVVAVGVDGAGAQEELQKCGVDGVVGGGALLQQCLALPATQGTSYISEFIFSTFDNNDYR